MATVNESQFTCKENAEDVTDKNIAKKKDIFGNTACAICFDVIRVETNNVWYDFAFLGKLVYLWWHEIFWQDKDKRGMFVWMRNVTALHLYFYVEACDKRKEQLEKHIK